MNLIKLEKEFKKILTIKYNHNNSLILNLLDKYNSLDWEKYIIFDEKEYKRNYIFKSELFDIILICWKKGQETKIHGHPKKGCYFKLLKGELQEDLYPPNSNDIKINIIKKDMIIYEHDSIGTHKVSNYSEGDAVGLYIYQSAGDYNPKK